MTVCSGWLMQIGFTECRWMSNVSLHTFTLGDIPPRVFSIKVTLYSVQCVSSPPDSLGCKLCLSE